MSVGSDVDAGDFIAAWRARANCRDEDPNLFYPGHEGVGRPAKSEKALGICAVCDVREECLEYALETNQEYGVWGGVEEEQRRRLRKRWLAEKRRNAPR